MTGVKQKRGYAKCNKNYVALALNFILKNSKKIILVSKIKRRDRNNSIKRRIEHIKLLKELS